jgi:DNA polymerase-3 subunit alpha
MSAEWREHEKLDRYMKDAARRGIGMRAPCVNASAAEFSVTEDGRSVWFGLAGVKNVGEGAVEAILAARSAGGPFRDLFDFCTRIDLRRVNRRVIESLIRCGAFDFCGARRAQLMAALDAALERGQRTLRDRELGQGSLFGEGPAAEPRLPAVAEWPRSELLAGEKEMLGFYVTGHPLLDHERVLRCFASFPLDRIPDIGGQRPEVWLGGLLSGLRTQKTRKGELMARAQLEDTSGAIAAVFFPRTFDQYAPLLRGEEPLFLRGKLSADEDRVELHVDEVIPIAHAWSRCTRRLVLGVDAGAADPERLRGLRALLDLQPGDVPVSLELRLPDGCNALLDLTQHGVAVSCELVDKIDALFSAEVATCIGA